MRLAERLRHIHSFRVMDIVDAAQRLEAEGHRVIHMEVGEPREPSDPFIRDAGAAALARGETAYTPALGLPALRRAIAAYYGTYHNVDLDPERVVVTAGATGALMLLSALLLDPEDEVLLGDPAYPCNRYFPLLFGAKASLMPLSPQAGFALTERDVVKAWGPRTRGVVLASPANPTGAVSSRAALQGLSEAAASRGGWALFDEIYQGLTYPSALDDQPALPAHGDLASDRVGTILSLQGGADHEFLVNSFSKYFGMTGWRVGWLVAPRAAIPAIEKLAQNAYIAPSTVGQHGALAALAPEVMPRHEARRLAYFRARNRLVTGLRALGFSVPVVPEGAFYVYPSIAGCIGKTSQAGTKITDDETFAKALLEETGVAVVFGAAFGLSPNFRVSYATSDKALEEACARIQRFCAGLR
ncbi:MAG: pyridoxal phosphate-dependent aminotransferase [Pseudomonadales bacterium]